ncbi:MAG: hypothetical protein M3Z24_02505 [Chloroflexota bacterium]|nr:hypothetical protein [Chloroflexota bacterium]
MAEHFYAQNNPEIVRLLALGFTPIQASRLVYMKEHVAEKSEYRENIQETRRLEFIRWLIEHRRMSL